jgi:NTP pyrophosphatase (non-canonical NTP hydrolase)
MTDRTTPINFNRNSFIEDWETYRDAIRGFCIYPDALTGSDLEMSYLTLGLASEAGEVAGLMKKTLRDELQMDAEQYVKWRGELSDVLWYVTRIADVLGFSLDEMMTYNYNKLNSRKERGVLGGNGDDR